MVKKFKASQRLRVIVGPACFYATAKQIRFGVGDLMVCNRAIARALQSLEDARSGTGAADQATCGISGRWEDLNVQINIA